MFLSSSKPLSALEMRRDLLQWEQALRLAQSLDPSQISHICTQFAQQLEFKGSCLRNVCTFQIMNFILKFQIMKFNIGL